MKNIWSPVNEINSETNNIREWSSKQILEYGLKELISVKNAIEKVIPECEKVADIIIKRFKEHGRVITVGAGGSGVAGMSVMRELPQNHRDINPDQFFYKVAGGVEIFNPLGCEELEDSFERGFKDMKDLDLNKKDVILLISASGRTPYILGASESAKKNLAYTVGVLCQESELSEKVDLPIFIDVGPEILLGATCEKAATAQKHILDMIMNVVVVRLGLTDKNICRARLVHEKAKIRDRFFTNKN